MPPCLILSCVLSMHALQTTWNGINLLVQSNRLRSVTNAFSFVQVKSNGASIMTVDGNTMTTAQNLYVSTLFQGANLWVRAGETLTTGDLAVNRGDVSVLGVGTWSLRGRRLPALVHNVLLQVASGGSTGRVSPSTLAVGVSLSVGAVPSCCTVGSASIQITRVG